VIDLERAKVVWRQWVAMGHDCQAPSELFGLIAYAMAEKSMECEAEVERLRAVVQPLICHVEAAIDLIDDAILDEFDVDEARAVIADARAALAPAFPLAHRTDLPQHEREISAEALALLHRGKQDVLAGRVCVMDPSAPDCPDCHRVWDEMIDYPNPESLHEWWESGHHICQRGKTALAPAKEGR
jgi:hypothetical protein